MTVSPMARHGRGAKWREEFNVQIYTFLCLGTARPWAVKSFPCRPLFCISFFAWVEKRRAACREVNLRAAARHHSCAPGADVLRDPAVGGRLRRLDPRDREDDRLSSGRLVGARSWVPLQKAHEVYTQNFIPPLPSTHVRENDVVSSV
jgi:hypothetical protein